DDVGQDVVATVAVDDQESTDALRVERFGDVGDDLVQRAGANAYRAGPVSMLVRARDRDRRQQHQAVRVRNLSGDASELWRRTAQQATRLLNRFAKQHGDQGRVRLSFGKAAEYQRRGVVHFHALIRLDGRDPDNPDTVLPPPAWATVFVL